MPARIGRVELSALVSPTARVTIPTPPIEKPVIILRKAPVGTIRILGTTRKGLRRGTYIGGVRLSSLVGR